MPSSSYILKIEVVGSDKASGPIGKVSSALGGAGSVMAGMLGAELFKSIGRGIVNMGKDAIEATGNYERLTGSMETLLARELKNTGAAETMSEALLMVSGSTQDLLGWVEILAIKSPFDQKGVATALQTAMAYGFTSDEAKRLTQTTIDYASGAGKQIGAMNQVALALGQIKAKGKLAGQEVLQLVNAGIAVDQILAQAMGKSTAEIVKMRESGLIPANEAIEMIVSSLEDDFAGAAERQANTWAGLTNTFEDIKEIGLREMFSGILAEVKPLAVGFADWLQADGMVQIKELAGNLGDVTKNLVEGAKGAGEFFGQLKSAGTNIFGKIFGNIDSGALVSTLGDAFKNIQDFSSSSNIGDTFSTMFDGALNNISELAGNVIPFFVAQIEKITSWVKENQPLIDTYIAALSEGWLIVQTAVVDFWSVVEPIFSGLIDIVLDMAKLIMQFSTGDWSGAWDTIVNVLNTAGESIMSSITALFEWVAGLFGSSLEELSATWSSIWENIVSSTSEKADSIFLKISDVFLNIQLFISTSLLSLQEFISSTMETISEIWSITWEVISTVVSTIFGVIMGAAVIFIDWILSFFDTSILDLYEKWFIGWLNIKEIVTSTLEIMREFISTKFEEINENITEKIESIKQSVNTGFLVISGYISTKMTEITTTISTAWNDISTKISEKTNEVGETIKEAAGEWLTVLNEKASQYYDEAVNYMSQFGRGLRKGISEALKAIADVGSTLLDAWKNVTAGIGSISLSTSIKGDPASGGGAPSGGDQEFARGGVARGPASGYKVLLHGDEAVVPLAGGRSIPVALSGNSGGASFRDLNITIVESKDARATAKETMSELRLQGVIQ